MTATTTNLSAGTDTDQSFSPPSNGDWGLVSEGGQSNVLSRLIAPANPSQWMSIGFSKSATTAPPTEIVLNEAYQLPAGANHLYVWIRLIRGYVYSVRVVNQPS